MIFECLACFRVKEDKLDPQVKKFVFLGVKSNLKDYKWDNKNKKFVLSAYVTFDEASMLMPNSRLVEIMKTKYRSWWRMMLLHVLQLVQYH